MSDQNTERAVQAIERARRMVDGIAYDMKAVPVFEDEMRVCNAYHVVKLVAKLISSESWNEERWRYCAGAYAQEREARQRLAHRAAVALRNDGLREKDICNCDQAVHYATALGEMVTLDLELPANDEDLLGRLSKVLMAHGERLNTVAEFWSKQADETSEQISELNEKVAAADADDDDLEALDVLQARYQHLTGHAMAAMVLGLELRGELEKISLTVQALNALGQPDPHPLMPEDMGVGFSASGEMSSGELALELNVEGKTGTCYLSREMWNELGVRAGWATYELTGGPDDR